MTSPAARGERVAMASTVSLTAACARDPVEEEKLRGARAEGGADVRVEPFERAREAPGEDVVEERAVPEDRPDDRPEERPVARREAPLARGEEGRGEGAVPLDPHEDLDGERRGARSRPALSRRDPLAPRERPGVEGLSPLGLQTRHRERPFAAREDDLVPGREDLARRGPRPAFRLAGRQELDPPAAAEREEAGPRREGAEPADELDGGPR